MLNKIDWKALIFGACAKSVIESALYSVLFLMFGRYMRIILGASPWWIEERFRHSPIGLLSSIFASLAAYWILGFVVGHFAKRSPFFTVGAYFVIEALLSLLALGLDIPSYARVNFWESLILLFCIIAAYVGVLSNERVVKNHARS